MTSGKIIAPYGTWDSPITSDLIVGQAIGLGAPVVDGGDIIWLESRPSEAGRSVLVRRGADGRTTDITPPPFNVRSRVHEYGGGAFAVHRGLIVFVNFSDQRLYAVDGTAAPRALTPVNDQRFADLHVDRRRDRIICVCEDHSGDGEPQNSLVAVPLGGGAPEPLADGHDFFAAPALSPDGRQLAWMTWDHPNMPWDASDLWLAAIDGEGRLGKPRHIAGGPAEAPQQPLFSPDGVLHFISDRSGWWNLYVWSDGEALPLCPLDAEFGQPLWQLGTETYRFLANGAILCTYIDDGIEQLARLEGGRLQAIPTPYAVTSLPAPCGDRLVLLGAAVDRPACIALLEPRDGAVEVVKLSTEAALDPADISRAEAITFPTEGGLTSRAFYYPPRSARFDAPPGEKPPLLVIGHGGPTGATGNALSLRIQYWTSRGFAVVDVNYGGSSGFGRAYRDRLAGTWGIVDVDDCVNAARFLAKQGLADADRLIIRGGSAGGYTTLSALTFRDTFRAGTSLYGIGDLETLARDTHKFESRYLDRIVGPWPEARDVYRQRSPINFTERLNCPVIFFQGLEDKVVPPNQAEAMVAALKAQNLPVAYLAFEGEGHGFRQAATIKRVLESELVFYGKVFGFEPAGDLPDLEIANL